MKSAGKELLFPGGLGDGCSCEVCLPDEQCGTIEVLQMPPDLYMLVEEKIGDCCHYIWHCIRGNCGKKVRLKTCGQTKLDIGSGRFRAVLIDCKTGCKVAPDDTEVLVRLCKYKVN